MRDSVELNGLPAHREPAFDVPWPVLALTGALIGAHALRLALSMSGDPLALSPGDLTSGGAVHLVTHLFVHGSWAHVLMNAAFTLTFGAPVARYLGLTARGIIAFTLFFLACGMIAALGFVGWTAAAAWFGYPSPNWGLLGASGAASGLFGAAARLMGGRGRLGSILGRQVLVLSAVWIATNLVLGLSGLTPGAAGAPVAWQAHLAGFVAGLILIGPFAALAGRSRDHVIAP